jgi:hypothetical protein
MDSTGRDKDRLIIRVMVLIPLWEFDGESNANRLICAESTYWKVLLCFGRGNFDFVDNARQPANFGSVGRSSMS